MRICIYVKEKYATSGIKIKILESGACYNPALNGRLCYPVSKPLALKIVLCFLI